MAKRRDVRLDELEKRVLNLERTIVIFIENYKINKKANK